jgi:hypothetical protein
MKGYVVKSIAIKRRGEEKAGCRKEGPNGHYTISCKLVSTVYLGRLLHCFR